MATEIGSVEDIKVSAFGTPVGEPRRSLSEEDDVFGEELVETAPRGALHIQFLDETSLRLGSDSQVVLDRFVYDPAAGAEDLTVELGQGVFRIITGEITPDRITIVTPVATIGVRGTDFILKILATGALVLAVLKGQVVVTPLAGNAAPTLIDEMETAGVDASGQIDTQVAPPSVDVGLGYDAARALLAMLQQDNVAEDGAAVTQAVEQLVEDMAAEDEEIVSASAGPGGGSSIAFLTALLQALTSFFAAQNPNLILTQTETMPADLQTGTPGERQSCRNARRRHAVRPCRRRCADGPRWRRPALRRHRQFGHSVRWRRARYPRRRHQWRSVRPRR